MRLFKDRLENNEIKTKLKSITGVTLTDSEISIILNTFWFQDYYKSLISFPTYLDLFISFLQQKGSGKFKRTEFYQYVTNKLIPSEVLSKLQKVTFAFEVLQTNEVPLEEFNSILSKLGLTKDSIQYNILLDNNVIKETEVKEKDQPQIKKVGLFHHTIGEYLASQLILSKSDPIDTFTKFAVYSDTHATGFVSSWRGVLRFLLESDKATQYIKWAFDFFETNKESLTDDVLDILLRETDPNIISKEKCSYIFRFIYELYFERNIWLPYWAGSELGKFANNKEVLLLKERWNEAEEFNESYITKGNIVAIVSGMLEKVNPLVVEDKTYWKDIFIKGANDINTNGVLQRHSLSALENFDGSDELTNSVKKAWEMDDQLVKEAFLMFCFTTSPNSSLTLDYLVEAICSGYGIYGRLGIYNINDQERLKDLIRRFKENEKFFEQFIEDESIYNDKEEKADNVLLQRISNVASADTEMVSLIKDLLRLALSPESLKKVNHSGYSYFLNELFKIASKTDTTFVTDMVKTITADKDNAFWLLQEQAQNIGSCITNTNAHEILNLVLPVDNQHQYLMHSMIDKVKTVDENLGKDLYEKYLGQQH